MRRVLVCGGRSYTNAAVVRAWLDKLHAQKEITLIIHGGCRMKRWPATGLVSYEGADGLADTWAKDAGVPTLVFLADWASHFKGAGPIRNTKMFAEGKPDIVIAFPGGTGTADMLRKARAGAGSEEHPRLCIFEVYGDGGIVRP